MAEIFLDPGADVELADVLVALGRLLAWAGAVAICALIVAFVYAILWPLNKLVSSATFGIVGSVPGTHAVESAVTSALGSAVSSFDKQVGSFWHGLTTIVGRVADEIFGLAALIGYVYWWINVKLPEIIWHRIGKALHAGVQEAQAAAHTAERDALRAEKHASSIERHLSHRIAALPATIEADLNPEITAARDLARSAEDKAEAAWQYIRSHPWTVATGAFASAVAVALTSLGLGWLKCDSNPFNGNKNACGLWSDLGRLLGLAAFLTLAFDFEEFVKASDEVAGFIGDAVGTFEGKFPIALDPLPPPA